MRSSSSPSVSGGGRAVADVFLSYAREDADVARRLAYLFECEDWSCWLDSRRVRWEVDRARRARKLAELALGRNSRAHRIRLPVRRLHRQLASDRASASANSRERKA
jgi:hypothetical protein